MVYDSDETSGRAKKQSWWKQRTKMERCEFISLAVAILIIAGLITTLVLLNHQAERDISLRRRRSIFEAVAHHRPVFYQRTPRTKFPPPFNSASEEESDEVCLTPGCVHAAETVLNFIDPSVDPCVDFYQFACGRFLKETTIPDNKVEVNPFTVVNDLVQKQLREIIEVPSKSSEPKPFTLLKTLYSVCMNTSAIEADNLTSLQDILKDLGGWPVLEGESWDDEGFDWKTLLYGFKIYGLSINSFFEFHVIPDPKNSSRRVLELDQVQLDIRRENLLEGLEDLMVKAYSNYMVDLAELFGADREFAEEEVQNMMEFKIDIANITTPDEDRRNGTLMYNPMTVRALQRRYTGVSWLELVNDLLAPVKGVSYDDIVIVSEPQYFSGLEKLLKRSSKRAQANYAIFQIIRSLEPYLSDKIRSRTQQFNEIVFGIKGREPRWIECVTFASESLNLAAGALYIRKHFSKDVKRNVMNMVADIRIELVKLLEEIDWMDNTTRIKAIEKAIAMLPQIAYADELLDDKKLEEYYSGLQFGSKTYLQIRNELSKFLTDKMYGQLWNPVNKSDWSTRIPPTTINAGYAPNENSIQIPAAILQGVFFDQNRPNYMNYAAIGTIIGHEITHGFDDEGKQFDKGGNLVNWWAERTDEAFAKKTKCIIDQYGNYKVPEVGIYLNGINTQGENIADNGGVKEAYLAYKAWVKRNGPEHKLPSLNYTSKQMFWISTANIWCTKERNESLETSVLTDTHSPGRFRVIVPLSNMVYFAKDFNCPVGSNMNPKHKCKVW